MVFSCSAVPHCGSGGGERECEREKERNKEKEGGSKRKRVEAPPAPMNHVKIFKGWPPQDAPSTLAQLWYKSFPTDQRGRVEMKKPTN